MTEGGLAARIREESARLAEACTRCGDCVRACPMVAQTAIVAAAEPGAVVGGVLDVLRGGAGTPEALAFISACTRSEVCTPACPERINPAFMMRLAGLRVRGALGEAPRVKTRDDPGWSARVKAFARLTMTEEEQEKWL